ncbi:MAG: cytochrome c [Fimbriimonadales bacterium]|nr:MAG: hypothetical protein KatS3mg018_1828 [Fimbriimonadales bacterium]
MRRGISLASLGIVLVSVAISIGSVRPAPIKVVETYERKCSSCHGKEGAMLDKDFEKKYASASELREVVESMPGAIGMRSDALEAMLAYTRSISRREPFVVWTEQRGDVIIGEVSPAAATVQARAKRETLRVQRTQNQWRITLPKGVRPEDVEITAQRGGVRTTLRLKDSPYSHTK